MTQESPNAYKGLSVIEKVLSVMPLIATGGSTSIPDGWYNMRYAGATAREMLIKAAADRWSIDPTDCYAEKGQVINSKTRERLDYGVLAYAAAEIELDELPELKKRADFKVIGKPVQRLDIPEKVNGSAEFGLDIRRPDMLYAAIKHPSTIGGKITRITNEEEMLKMAGVKRVFITDERSAAVVADNTWRADVATRIMEVEEERPYSDLSSEMISAQMRKIMEEKALATPESHGDVDSRLESDEGVMVEGTYEVPYLAHATMEPMNCTVHVTDEECTAWVGHQAPSVVHGLLSEVTGTPKDRCKVNITYLGGGFGRRGEPDYIRQAANIAREMKGTPVQTVFTLSLIHI